MVSEFLLTIFVVSCRRFCFCFCFLRVTIIGKILEWCSYISQLTPTSLSCYSPSRLDPLKFSFFGDRLLWMCTNISRERRCWNFKWEKHRSSRFTLLVEIEHRFVSSSFKIRFMRLELCLSVFSLLFFVDNNPTKGKKLMLKDECHLNISRHVRYVVNVKAAA